MLLFGLFLIAILRIKIGEDRVLPACSTSPPNLLQGVNDHNIERPALRKGQLVHFLKVMS
jgi:hypothetical protein